LPVLLFFVDLFTRITMASIDSSHRLRSGIPRYAEGAIRCLRVDDLWGPKIPQNLSAAMVATHALAPQ
jgi:hypothetical protein